MINTVYWPYPVSGHNILVNLSLGLYLCRLFSDDSSDSIQFLADSDEQQNDNAAAGSTLVCIVAAIGKEKLLIVPKYYHSVAEKTVTVMHCCFMLRCRNQREMNRVENSQLIIERRL